MGEKKDRVLPLTAGEGRHCEIEDYKSWLFGLNAAHPRFLHIMLRIRDPERSLKFYIDGLGMKLLGRFDVEERRVTAFFVGYEVGATAVELGYYWGTHEVPSHGTGYRYMAIGVPDLEACVSRVESLGAEVTIRPTILVDGMPRAAFVKDPDGYSVELFQTWNN